MKDHIRKTCWVYICQNCEGIYRDAPVSQCDCMPDETVWSKAKLTYWLPLAKQMPPPPDSQQP